MGFGPGPAAAQHSHHSLICGFPSLASRGALTHTCLHLSSCPAFRSSGFSWWIQCHYPPCERRKRGKQMTHSQKKSDVTTREEVGMGEFEDGGKDHESRMYEASGSCKKQGSRFPPQPPTQTHFDFSLCDRAALLNSSTLR